MFKGSTASQDLDEVVRALKGAAEPTRLRLLSLLSQGEFTVGELCAVLGQSQPRISRHLRLLTEAGLLDRFREQQCVYYRAPVTGRFLEWSRQVLTMADPDGEVLARDRERAHAVVQQRQVPALDAAPHHELARVVLEELGPVGAGELLDIGTGGGAMLQILGPRAQHAVGIDISSSALRLARNRIHGIGLVHCEFRRGDMYGLPYADASFDTVTIDRVLAGAERPVAAISEAARTLRAGGRLLLVEDFDQLEQRTSDNPLSQLRRWLVAAGLNAERLRPFDSEQQHFIIASARHQLPANAAGPSAHEEPRQQRTGRAA